MALLWIEGCEGFGTSVGNATSPVGIVGRKYVTVGENDLTVETGRLGGYSLLLNGATPSMYTPALTTDATLVVGMAIKFTQFHANPVPFLHFYDNTTQGMNLRVTSTGELGVYRGSTAINTTVGLSLLTGTWYYIEFKVLCDDTVGTYEVRVGGANVLSDTGVDTKASTHTYHNIVRLYQNTVYVCYPYYDDIYCLDGSGATNNDFLGNMRVIAIRPDGDTAANAWTRSGGAENFDLVNESICDDDTGYVESAVSTTKDLYTYGAISELADSVKGIQINTVCRETDANSFSLVTVAKLGATESNSAASAIGTTDYIMKTRLMETDPTGNAWTIANVDASEFGIKVN
jgi:hypothetical protein